MGFSVVMILLHLIAPSLAVLLAGTAPEPGGTILVLPIEPHSAPLRESADSITTVLAAELRKQSGVRVMTMRELEGTMDVEMRRQVSGCGSASCAAEIAGALNAEEIVLSTLGGVGEGNLILSSSRIKARTAQVLGSATRRVKSADPGALLDEIPPFVAELLGGTPPVVVGGLGMAVAPRAPARDVVQLKPARHPDFIEVDTWVVPYQGPQRRELSWPEFFSTVDRKELAAAYLARYWGRVGLLVGGIGALVLVVPVAVLSSIVSSVGLIAGLSAGTGLFGWLPSVGAFAGAFGGVGIFMGGLAATMVLTLALVLGGVAMLFGAWWLRVLPVDDGEIHALAEAHNARLTSR